PGRNLLGTTSVKVALLSNFFRLQAPENYGNAFPISPGAWFLQSPDSELGVMRLTWCRVFEGFVGRNVEMTVGRSAAQKDNNLSFLTELPLGRLTPRGRAFYYPKGAIVREGNPPSEAAWFVSSGSCELRRNSSNTSGMVLRNFGPGEAFTTCGRS